MPQAWKYARVDYSPSDAELVAAKVTGWAAMGGIGPEKGPGFTQGEAVQFVTDLAVLRHSACVGVTHGQFALFDQAGRFYGTSLQRLGFRAEPGYQAIPMVGDETLPPAAWSLPYDEKLDPVDGWPRKLALAIDQVCTKIGKSEQAASIPLGYGIEPIPPAGTGEGMLTAWPSIGVVAVIVGGAALAAIGTVAVWRYLDADVRMHAARVRAAAKAYQTRLEAYHTTGQMPAASTLETSNAEAVNEIASDQRNRYWLYGAAAVGGIALGAIGVSYLQRER